MIRPKGCKKILFCDNSLRDLLNFRGKVLRHYAEQGAEILLVAPPTCPFESQNRQIRYIPVSVERSGKNPFSDLAYFGQLLRIYRREKPDIIFHYTIKRNIYGTLAAKIVGCMRVAMVAGLGYMFTGNGIGKRLGRLLYKIGLRNANRVLVLNRPNLDQLVTQKFILPERAVLLQGGEGVDLSRFHYVENRFETVRFLMVARVLYDKGYSEYVEAASRVKRQYPHIEFGLLGPLDETSPMAVPRSVVEKDVDEGKITYFGVTNDVPSYLSRDGVVMVLCSSYGEGLNRSLMEACAMARPCIATDIPGCRETVDDGINGYLVPQKNVQALADAILRFIALPLSEKQAMSKASRRIAEKRFDMKTVIEIYNTIIKSLNV